MTKWKREPWYSIDTETTGLGRDARIVQIAGVRFEEGEPVDVRGVLVDPGIPIPAEAAAVHGITDERVAGKADIGTVLEGVLPRISEAPVLVAYNAPFDLRMLRQDAERIGATTQLEHALEGCAVLDPLVVVRLDNVGRYWRGKGRHKLTSVAERFRLEGDPRWPAHDARTDAILAGRVLWRLRDKLPDDLEEALRMLTSESKAQQRAFEQWKASQRRTG